MLAELLVAGQIATAVATYSNHEAIKETRKEIQEVKKSVTDLQSAVKTNQEAVIKLLKTK